MGIKKHGSSHLTVFAISCIDHVTGVEIAEKINPTIRPNDDLLTVVRNTGTPADQNSISRTKKKHPEKNMWNNCTSGGDLCISKSQRTAR